MVMTTVLENGNVLLFPDSDSVDVRLLYEIGSCVCESFVG